MECRFTDGNSAHSSGAAGMVTVSFPSWWAHSRGFYSKNNSHCDSSAEKPIERSMSYFTTDYLPFTLQFGHH